MYPSYGVNKHALMITITTEQEVRFSIRFLQMFQCRFANATQVFVVLIESVEVGEHEK